MWIVQWAAFYVLVEGGGEIYLSKSALGFGIVTIDLLILGECIKI